MRKDDIIDSGTFVCQIGSADTPKSLKNFRRRVLLITREVSSFVIPLTRLVKKRWRLSLAVLSGLCLIAGGLRIYSAPVRLDNFKPIIISRLENALPGHKADIGHMDLVWFHDANALGWRFEGLTIRDSRKRVVASAKSLEAALAIDSLFALHIAPARLTAKDFFLAATVSERGRYELGYEAKGQPQARGGVALDRLFRELVGPEKLGSPISYTRQFALRQGRLDLRQVNSNLAWTADIGSIDYTKRDGRIRANLGLSIKSGNQISKLTARASATEGLKTAAIDATISNLIPSTVFPSVGMTRPMAGFHAPVNGTGTVKYSARHGFETTDLDISAGKGYYDFGKSKQSFEAMNVVATYARRTKRIDFKRFRVVSPMLEADLFGHVKIWPSDVKVGRKLLIDFDFKGPKATGKLADDFRAQTLNDVHFTGAYSPDTRELFIKSGRGRLETAVVTTKGRLYADDKGLGANLTARIDGDFTKETVFAFWPEGLTKATRLNLIDRIKVGTLSNADFTLSAPPGYLTADNLRNEDLRLDFDFRDATIEFDPRLKDGTGLKGHAVLMGSRFDLDVESGWLDKAAITDGQVLVPSFHSSRSGRGSLTHIWIKAKADAVDVIEAVDPIAGGDLAKNGLNRERLGGQADVRVDIRFPTFQNLSTDTFDLTFNADLTDASLKQAALGWDLTDATIRVDGDLRANRIVASGPGVLGPYRGEIAYHTAFSKADPKVTFKGQFDAEPFGGAPDKPVPIEGEFILTGGSDEGTQGSGQIRSGIFDGDVAWEGTDERPNHVTIRGETDAKGMAAQGLPFIQHLGPKLPTQVSLIRSGDIWSGEIQAQAFSGDLAYIEGANPRLVYQSVITPDEARELGLSGMPLFRTQRRLSLNIGLDDQTREALIRVDQFEAKLGWAKRDASNDIARTLTAKIAPQDWASLGLPEAFFKPSETIDAKAQWLQTGAAMSGQIDLKGHVIDFTVPDNIVGSNGYQAQIRTRVNDGLLTLLGYTHDRLTLTGQADVVTSLYRRGDRNVTVVNVYAQDAELKVLGSDWVKPAGEAADFAFEIDDKGAGQGMNIARIYGNGASVKLEGRASLDGDGKIEFADLSEVYLKNLAEGSVKYYEATQGGPRLISATGRYFDLRPWLVPKANPQTTIIVADIPHDQPPVEPPPPSPAVPTRLVADVQTLKLSRDGAFHDVKINVDWDGANGLDGSLNARSENNSLIRFEAEPDTAAQPAYSRFEGKLADTGDALKTAFATAQVHRGETEIKGVFTRGQVDATISGEHIQVRQIPILAQLLTVGSLQGLANTLTGEGITFDEYELPVRYRVSDQLLFIKDGYAKGEAVGINVWGTFDRDNNYIDYRGSLLPVYAVNSMFGDVAKKGQGLVGLRYRVRGRPPTPQVEVDPFSLVIPGFLRQWFDKDFEDEIPPLNLPDAKKSKD
ncbi:hypothetical protein GCM10011273_28700 [Asticcacaulis endophyticus]|uniref:DUF3971 domain-containing protein n=1 Tax=Asticcacaulis endophyticus TaxID=1395890 RepID=A0A918QC26_9CAUL|nr:hypothetical protein GCM10011273_28700 [Asticcacaulis endophyticus]